MPNVICRACSRKNSRMTRQLASVRIVNRGQRSLAQSIYHTLAQATQRVVFRAKSCVCDPRRKKLPAATKANHPSRSSGPESKTSSASIHYKFRKRSGRARLVRTQRAADVSPRLEFKKLYNQMAGEVTHGRPPVAGTHEGNISSERNRPALPSGGVRTTQNSTIVKPLSH